MARRARSISENLYDEVDAIKGAVISMADRVKTSSRDCGHEMLDHTKKHPVKALGIAMGVGLLLGLLIKK